MKRINKVISALLALSVVSGMTACGETAETTVDVTTEATTEVTTFERMEEVDNVVSEKLADVEKVELENKTLKWLAWWEVDLTTPSSTMLKEQYGVDIESNVVTYEQRYDQLATLIASGNSPDAFPFEINNYPYSVNRSMFQPVDDYIDYSSDFWSVYKDEVDLFKWGGKNYVGVQSVEITDLLWYRKSVVDDIGGNDPYELYKNGEWTWDAFLELCYLQQQSGEDKYAIDGWEVYEGMVCTTGVPFISINNGKLMSNLNNANVERASDLVSTLCLQELRYPRHLLNANSVNTKAFIDGSVLFFAQGRFTYDSYWSRYDIGEDIGMVPFPRDPNSDEYYQQASMNATMLCSGAPNPEAYKVWMEVSLLCLQDPDIIATTNAQLKQNYNWTDELLEQFRAMNYDNELTWVFDFKNGIGGNVADLYGTLNAGVYLDASTTLTQFRSENEGMINSLIDDMNNTVA